MASKNGNGTGNSPAQSAKVAIYCRVSSEEQVETNTIQNQVEYARKYVDLNGLSVHDFYLDDGVSGTVRLTDRSEGARMLADAKAGHFGLVLVYRVDRMARRLKVLLEAHDALQELRIGLRSMTEPIDSTTPIGRFVFQLLGSLAELERETIVERTVLGSNRKAAEGKWLGGIVPYGYRVDADGYLAVCEDKLPGHDLSEADVVRMCYRLLLDDGLSTFKIADRLNSLGIPPSYAKDGRQILRGKRKEHTSGVWLPGRVRNMLKLDVYRGVHLYGKRATRARDIIERSVPAIVPKEVWSNAQARMRNNQCTLSPQNATRFYLLRGLIKCDRCGLTFCGTPGGKREQAYYKCNGKQGYRGKIQGRCQSKPVPAAEIEDTVWADIKEFVLNPGPTLERLQARLRAGVDIKDSVQGELEQVTQAIQRKQRERETILGLLRKETITFSEGERELNKIAEETRGLQEQQQALFARAQESLDQERNLLNAEVLLERLREKVESADDNDKRQLVEALVREIRVNTVGDGRRRTAEVTITYAFDEPVARTGTDSSLQLARTWPETSRSLERG